MGMMTLSTLNICIIWSKNGTSLTLLWGENEMIIFQIFKTFFIIFIAFITLLVIAQSAKSDTSCGRIKQYRAFCIDNSIKNQLPYYF